MIADLLSNFWVALVAKLLLVALAIPLIGMVVGFGEMKLSAKMQARVGPYFAGGRWGWAQLLADGIKFFQTEDLIPRDADKPVFKFAPVVVMMGTVALFVVIPWGPGLIFRDLSVGIFYALAISSLTTVGVLMAGWSSANKYSLIGGLRAAGQMIAYELPLVFSALAVVIMAGTMSMQGIVEAQIEAGYPFVILQIVGFVIFVIASLAELSRIPFDLPIAESELVMGYLTEYSGFRFLFFFLAEFANMFSMSAIAVTLFLGGWYLPGIPADALEYLGPVILVVKSLILVFAMIWFRWAFPRVRQDQLQSLAWKWLIPISLANVILTGVFKVVL
jgi:NADH-quinone oxidoreductase subunit H